MMQKDIKLFFNLEGNIDEMFIKEMNYHRENGKIPVSIHWLKKYTPGKYSDSFKKILFSYVETALLNPEIVIDNPKVINLGPKILFYHFDEIFHSFNDLSLFCSVENIFVPLIKHLGNKILTAPFEETTAIIDKFNRLMYCGNVYTVFLNTDVWKLRKIENKTNPIPFFNTLINEFVYIRPLIDNFFEPFIYKSTDIFCPMTFKNKNLRELSHKYNSIIKNNNELMHSTITFLIKKDKKIKNNFINYIRDKYLENKNKLKLVHEKENVISDGFAVNFNYLLLLLAEGIFKKKLDDFDLLFFKDEEFLLTTESKVDEEKNEFNLQTAVFLGKIVFFNYSYNKIMENHRETEYKISYVDSENIKEAMASFLNAYRTILYSDIFREEKNFLSFFSEYLGNNLENKLVPDVLLNCYFDAAEYAGHVLPNFVIPKNIIDKFVFKKIELVKVIYHNFNTYDINMLINLYVLLENKDIQVKNELRFYLTKMLVNGNNLDQLNLEDLTIIRFYSYILNDLENMLAKLISSILSLKRKLSEEEKDAPEISRLKNEIDHRIIALGGIFDLLDTVDVSVYTNRNLISQFTSVLNHNLKRLIGPNCNELNTKEIKVKIDFKEILRRVLKMYIKMAEENIFIINLVNDKINFNINLLKKAYEISESKFILNENELAKINDLMASINKTLIEVNTEDEFVPDEFIDPVTCVMMEEPVMLNGSKVVVDKSTYEMLLIGQMNDPFNREELSGFTEDLELKRKIDEFKEKRLNKN